MKMGSWNFDVSPLHIRNRHYKMWKMNKNRNSSKSGSNIKSLSRMLNNFMTSNGLTFREMQARTGVDHTLIFRLSKRSGVSYENGKKIENYLYSVIEGNV